MTAVMLVVLVVLVGHCTNARRRKRYSLRLVA
jgi:hypothetical protein